MSSDDDRARGIKSGSKAVIFGQRWHRSVCEMAAHKSHEGAERKREGKSPSPFSFNWGNTRLQIGERA
jgi:hypothetical protein